MTDDGVVTDDAPVPERDPWLVDPQVVDAVAQANVETIGGVAAQAVDNLLHTTAQAIGHAAQAATLAHQHGALLSAAATAHGLAVIASLSPTTPEVQELVATLIGRLTPPPPAP